ncbi:MAG: S9 family peptidase [Saprospiraceae bacterium]|jgi:dipeptidyl aminopeptidase/acylaminoacyl peptidase|nr:S9 family peptidase [Saprospiraceae bacterium]
MENNKTLPGDPTLPSSSEELQKLIAEEYGNFKYSVEDFFKKPDKTRYQLSKKGTHFSFMGPYKNRQNVFTQKIGTSDITQITFETDRDLAWYFWANNSRIIYGKDDGGNENFHLYAVNADGSDLIELTPFKGVRIDIIDTLEDFDDEIIIGMNKNNPQLFEPYRLNIINGKLTQLAENNNPVEPISEWMTDHDGKLRVAIKVQNGTNSVIMYRKTENEPFKEVLTTDFRVTLSPLFFEFDNGNIVYASSNLGRDKSAIVKFDLEAGKEYGAPLFEHEEVDVSQLSFSRKRKVLTSILYTTDLRHRHFLDAETESIYKRLKKSLGDYEIFVTSHNKAEDKFMVRTFSDRSLGAYYFYDKTKDELTKIVEVSPWIKEEDMSEMHPIKYTSRDGLTINGYLTLPKGKIPKNLPVVVNPHGGPWARDEWGYNPEIQLMASRGYAILQMNFRSSTGYGREFWEKGFKKWGDTMQNDITDGVNYLIEQGIANPKRIAIYGGSYGGYATLAGVTYTPDLYACAIDYVGVSNLFSFMKTIPPYWEPYLKMMYEMVGNPDEEKERMHKYSPVFHVDKIKAPLFVVQGANDPRVNIDEADQIVKALRNNGIEVPYLVKYNEGHGFGNQENQFEFYKAMIGFLGKYLS